MLKNYFKIAWRNIARNKVYSLINISGLALGMAGAILLMLNIQFGLSVDQFHKNKENIYEAYNKGINGGQLTCWNATAAPLAPALSNYPEITKVARVLPSSKLLRFGDKRIPANGSITDPGFLSIFSFPLLKGSTQSVLSLPNSIVLTEKLAAKIFGNDDPVNKTITTPTGDAFVVTGILKDLPDNTQFRFEYLLPWEFLRAKDKNAEIPLYWNNQNLNTFVELKPDARIEAVNKKIAGVAAKGSPLLSAQTIFLYPLSKVYLENRFENGQPAGGNIDNMRLLGGLAAIILLIACINFMNLSTARSEKRAREVGIRKVVGSSRHSLIYQFIGESVLMAFLAGIIALVLTQIVLPTFSSLARASLSVPWESPSFWVAGLAFVLLTGLLAGSYPAFYLSSFRPVQVLKGAIVKGHALVTPRKILVVLQFVFSIFLINFTVIYQKQIQYGLDRTPGFVKENLVFHPLTDDLRRNLPAVRNELLQSGVVLSLCVSNTTVTRVTGVESGLKWGGMDAKVNPGFVLLMESGGFIRTNGLSLVTGRDVDLEHIPGDSVSCVINEASAKILGFSQPVGQVIQDEAIRWKIVGVVKNFLIGDPDQAAEPVLIKGSNNADYLTMRMAGTSMSNIQRTEAILRKYNPNYFTDMQFADEDYSTKFRQARNAGMLINCFAFVAIFISCMGLLGLSTFMAENRTREIGIRKVLGASVSSITTLLAGDFVRLILLSILIASPLAWFAMRSFLQQFSYRTSVNGWVLVVAGGGALSIALVTISFQVIRAAMANPIRNLRTE